MIHRLLLWFAVTDRDVAKDARLTDWARKRQSVLGTSVLLTGCFAFLSGSYALYITFDTWYVAAPVGIAYAAFIVTIDRMIVSSTNWWSAAVRLPLAIGIGIVVAVPLEIRLAETRIQSEVEEETRATNERIRTEELQNSRVPTLKAQLENTEQELEAQREEAREAARKAQCELAGSALPGCSGRPGAGPAYDNAKERERIAREQAQALSKELTQMRTDYREALDRVEERTDEKSREANTDFVGMYEELQQMKQDSRAIWQAAWGIKMLFILLEITPALLKMFMDKTAYDAALVANREVSISEFNQWANQRIAQIKAGTLSTNGQQQAAGTSKNPPKQRPNSQP
mgnify:CR=1 FL=1